MQTAASGGIASNNFGVARVRRDLPNRSSVGGLFVNRQAIGELAGDADYNRTFGFDGRWGFGQNGIVSGFATRTDTTGRVGEDYAYDVAVDYNAQAWRVRAGYMEMGDNFNPEVGFVRRRGFRKVDGGLFYTWRPDDFLKLQELRPHVTFNRFWNYDRGFIESSLLHMDNFWEFEDSSVATTAWNVRKESVAESFPISGVPVLPGSYDWNEASLSYSSDRSAPVNAGFRLGAALLRRRPKGLLPAARQELLGPVEGGGGEGGGGGLLDRPRYSISVSLGVVPRWYSRVVEVPVRIEVAAGFVAPGASEPPRLQPSWPPGGSRPAHG